MLNTLILRYKQPIKGCLWTLIILTWRWQIFITQMSCFINKCLEAILPSNYNLWFWAEIRYTPGNHLFYYLGFVAWKPVFGGLIRLDKNWPAQSQNPRVLAYTNLSNHTFQVANNKSVDQTAVELHLYCSHMQFAGGPGGFLKTGSNTKVGYIVPSDYLTELKYEKNIVWATTEKRDHSDSPYGQTFSVHAQHLSRSSTLVLWLNVSHDLQLRWANSEGFGATAWMRRVTWTFAYAINGNGDQ